MECRGESFYGMVYQLLRTEVIWKIVWGFFVHCWSIMITPPRHPSPQDPGRWWQPRRASPRLLYNNNNNDFVSPESIGKTNKVRIESNSVKHTKDTQGIKPTLILTTWNKYTKYWMNMLKVLAALSLVSVCVDVEGRQGSYGCYKVINNTVSRWWRWVVTKRNTHWTNTTFWNTNTNNASLCYCSLWSRYVMIVAGTGAFVS